jgi:hypothetical protein
MVLGFMIDTSRRQVRQIQELPVPMGLLQNCLQLADTRQGTTEVVPEMAHPDSGFSRY